MFKIIIEERAEKQLDIFVNSYKNIYRNLFFDSWIFSEKIIIQNYENTGDEFVDVILGYIQKNISSNIVLWRKINSENSYSLIFTERSFLIIIDYTEDIETKTRFIENIIFTKK